MLESFMKHFLITETDQRLPLYAESVGFNPHQLTYRRTGGYPYYHWLQTYEGEGEFSFAGETFILSPGQGVLLMPGVPHAYAALTPVWKTYYLTFSGSLVQAILSTMKLNHSNHYRLDSPELFLGLFHRLMEKVTQKLDFTGLEGSSEVYQFLILLKKYGQEKNNRELSHTYDRLNGLIEWLNQEFNNADIGLRDMANQLYISPQHLHYLFRSAIGTSPYAYFLQLRIQKSKEFLAKDADLTVKTVSSLVGFRSTSHFISTFRRLEGITPEQFKRMYG